MIKRILIVSQYFYPENFRINDMADAFKKRGYEVDVLTGLPNYPSGKIDRSYRFLKRRKETLDGIFIRRLPIIPRRKNPVHLILNYASFVVSGWVWVRFTKRTYDFIFSFEVSPMTQILPALWLSKKQQIPVVSYIQDIWPESLEMAGKKVPRFIQSRIQKMAFNIYKNLDHVLVPSNAYIPWVKHTYAQAAVSYWPQYYESFYAPVKKALPVKGINPDAFTIMFTGNIGASQGLDSIIDAVALIKDSVPANRLQLVLVGEGKESKRLKQKVLELKVSDWITFMGSVPPEDIPNYLAHADMAYLSFTTHALFDAVIPAKLQSYMACAKPVLVYAGGESAAIIKDAKAGTIVHPLTTEMLATRLKELLQLEKTQLTEWGTNGLDYAKTHFNKTLLLDWFEDTFLKGKTHV